MHQFTNDLVRANSPYLLQHAHNPVDWVEWSEEAFEEAEKEEKLVLISIGYSSCHWCHVMERECFEEEEVAHFMNKNFVCIKVDREERPDIDHIYMNAVQLMTQRGGWPLNCFALPDKRPIFGGTYFPKKQWLDVLQKLTSLFREDANHFIQYAERLEEGIVQSDIIQPISVPKEFNPAILSEMVEKWKIDFDEKEGGSKKVPKFPLPNNHEFLLSYAVQLKDKKVLRHVHKTLQKMALGGLYDQLGGGFSRYSTDREWKVPHFEKMLYDNGQLLSLYAKAYQQQAVPLYKRTIEQTINWLLTDMKDKSGGFYSAIDADSEGEEGKFYTWTKKELMEILGEDFSWFRDFYNVKKKGLWENGQYILLRSATIEEWGEKENILPEEWKKKLSSTHQKLLKVRKERVPPALDDKQLTSWNAMLITGLIDSGLAVQNKAYIEEAKNIGHWILQSQFNNEENSLWRTCRKGKSSIAGFLEDYAHGIDAFISLYEATFEKKWLRAAEQLMTFTLQHFYDTNSKMFFFTNKDTELIARKMEIYDNVIPSSNSVMAKNLFKLGKILDRDEYKEKSKQMLSNLYSRFPEYGSGFSNWGIVALSWIASFYEIAITGKEAKNKRFELGRQYLPNAVFIGGETPNLPLLKDKSFEKDSLIYLCKDYSCNAPTTSISEAMSIIRVS